MAYFTFHMLPPLQCMTKDDSCCPFPYDIQKKITPVCQSSSYDNLSLLSLLNLHLCKSRRSMLHVWLYQVIYKVLFFVCLPDHSQREIYKLFLFLWRSHRTPVLSTSSLLSQKYVLKETFTFKKLQTTLYMYTWDVVLNTNKIVFFKY